MRVGGLFDGVGLLAYGLHLAGLEHAWLCEVDPWRRSLLERRWPGVPVFDDVRAVGAGSAKRVDVIAGGFPCKGASTAGKRQGFGHPETVLWREMFRAIRELRPRYVLVENVANILALHGGAVWGEVVGDLASVGFDIEWDCLPAAAVGAPHLRDRVFAIATDAASRDGRPDARPGDHDARPQRLPAGRVEGADQHHGGDHAAPDPEGVGAGSAPGQAHALADRRDAREEPLRGGAVDPSAADARGDGVRVESEPEPGGSGATVAGRDGATPPYPGGGRRSQQSPEHGAKPAEPSRHALGRGVAVEWGAYEPAIRRWEAVHGPAPEPLVRRVDDRRASGVERSRLSALGDGVQVQLGRIAGERIMSLEAAHRSVAA